MGSSRVLQTLRSVNSDGIEKRKGKTVKRRQYVCPHGNKVFYFNFVFIIKIKVYHIAPPSRNILSTDKLLNYENITSNWRFI